MGALLIFELCHLLGCHLVMAVPQSSFQRMAFKRFRFPKKSTTIPRAKTKSFSRFCVDTSMKTSCTCPHKNETKPRNCGALAFWGSMIYLAKQHLSISLRLKMCPAYSYSACKYLLYLYLGGSPCSHSGVALHCAPPLGALKRRLALFVLACDYDTQR